VTEDRSRLAQTSQLLVEAFGHKPTTSAPYLEWLYADNPAGLSIEENLDDAEGLTGHYAIVPKFLAKGRASWRVGLSLNTAVAERARGGGIFVRLASAVIEKSKLAGLRGIVGVANENSTPGFIRRLGFNLEKSLPVKIGVCIPSSSKSYQTGRAALAAIAGFEANRRIAEPDLVSPLWTEDLLRWRLERPEANYFAISDDTAGVIGTRVKYSGIPFACLMGLFTAKPGTRASRVISAACAQAGAAFYVYAGWNRDVGLDGVALPRKLRPSPLNLIWRTLDEDRHESAGPSSFRRFEFLDFDAF